MLLCRFFLSFAVCLQPPRMCVLFRGDWHFEHVGVGPLFLLHLYTCTPHAISSASRRARKGVVEYACIEVVCAIVRRLFEDMAVDCVVGLVVIVSL